MKVTVSNCDKNIQLIYCKPVDALHLLGKVMVINFRKMDEKIFVDNKIDTFSLPTLLSVLAGRPLEFYEISSIFRKGCGIDYSIFDTSANVSILFQQKLFRRKIAGFLRKCLYDVQENHLDEFLLLEIRTLPVLYGMFGKGYPIDMEKAYAFYHYLNEIQRNEVLLFRKKYGVDYRISRTTECGAVIMQNRCQKREDKLKRFPLEVREASGKKVAWIVCRFHSIGTKTFRITTSRQNIQGLPKQLRKCLLPRNGDTLVEYDISSSQVILLACLAGEKAFINIYAAGKDLYQYIAATLFHKNMEDVDKPVRDTVKHIFLKLLYGAGLKTIQRDLQVIGKKLSFSGIKEMTDSLFQAFPKIRAYIQYAKEAEEIVLPSKRKISRLSGIAPNSMLACVLQGIESDILRSALVNINEKLETTNLAWIYLCIHDSIIVDLKYESRNDVRKFVRNGFQEAIRRYFPQIKNLNMKEEIINERNQQIDCGSK